MTKALQTYLDQIRPVTAINTNMFFTLLFMKCRECTAGVKICAHSVASVTTVNKPDNHAINTGL